MYVHGKCLHPLLHVIINDGNVPVECGIVDQYVDWSEGVLCSLNELDAVRFTGNVGCNRDGLPAGFPDLANRRADGALQHAVITVIHRAGCADHFGAFRRKQQCDLLPDSTTRAGDNGHPAVKLSHVLSFV